MPRIAFVNKMDKVGADFQMNLDSIRERLGARPVPIQWPVGQEDKHRGMVDLVRMKAAIFNDESLGAKFEWEEIPADLAAKCKEMRDQLIEACADADEAIMQKFIEGRSAEITENEIHAGIRKATVGFHFVPVVCGSAFKNKGVQLLLDAVINYLPSPVDVPPMEGVHADRPDGKEIRKADDEESFSALAFKIANDPFVGNLTYFRVYSGHVESGTSLLNATRGKRERIGRILRMHANKREELKECHAGNIYAAVGLRDTRTGDTLCDEKAPILLEKMTFPDPVISIAIEPKTQADLDKLGISLQKLAHEDPSFRTFTNEETGQTIIAGMGELHLEIIVDRLKREFKVEANVGKPEVAYREVDCQESRSRGPASSVRPAATASTVTSRSTSSLCARGGGFVFDNDIIGGIIPKEFISSIEKGIREAMARGVLAGYPLIDAKARLFDGSYHEVDSSGPAFEIAASMAFQDAAKRAGLHLLEPVMSVEVVTPEANMGDVMGDLNSRRGKILGMQAAR